MTDINPFKDEDFIREVDIFTAESSEWELLFSFYTNHYRLDRSMLQDGWEIMTIHNVGETNFYILMKDVS